MAAGKISIQANDGKVAGIVFEDGASSNVTVSVPKDGGTLVTQTGLSTKQDTLVSGTNIKTINSTSLLGSGNISITETAWVSNDSRAKTALNATGSAPIYACRAWVNFNGTGTVAIRASGNVSSITDNGVGDYTVNFTTAMADANYNTIVTTCNRSGEAAFGIGGLYGQTTGTVSGQRVATFNTSGREDFLSVNVSVFR